MTGTERVAYTSIFTAPHPPTDTPSTTLAVPSTTVPTDTPSTTGTIERDGVLKADRLPATGQQMNGIIALALACILTGTASHALRRTKN